MSKDPLNRLLDEVRASAFHPRTTILVGHGLVELIVNALVKVKCRNGDRILADSRQYPHSAKTVILNELDLLTDDELQILDRFRKLRNAVVHDADFSVTNEMIYQVKGAWPFQFPHGRAVDADQLKENLVTLCVSILAQVWGRHMNDLSAVFRVPGT